MSATELLAGIQRFQTAVHSAGIPPEEAVKTFAQLPPLSEQALALLSARTRKLRFRQILEWGMLVGLALFGLLAGAAWIVAVLG